MRTVVALSQWSLDCSSRIFTEHLHQQAEPSAVLENARSFGLCCPAQVGRIGCSHGNRVILKPAAVHQLLDPLDIKLSIGTSCHNRWLNSASPS